MNEMEVAALKTVIRRLFEALILTAALLSPLIARVAKAGVPAVRASACLKTSTDGKCQFGSLHAGLSLKLEGIEISAELVDGISDQSMNAISVSPRVSLTSDLHQRVRDGFLSAEDALLIETELVARRDAAYFLPSSFEQLKLEVGFSPEVQLSAEDSMDLVKVHVQLALSVSPATAAYLVDRLGVKAEMDGTSMRMETDPNSVPTINREPMDQESVPSMDAPYLRETASVAQTQS